MKILGIETSCDETAAAVVEDGRKILSNAVYTQIEKHRPFGGVVPEIASRCHTEAIYDITQKALNDANLTLNEIDAIAVTSSPGLIGALLVGVNFAKGLAFASKKPLIAVNHTAGHIASGYISNENLKPPFLCLVVSGGHTSIVKVTSYTDFTLLGATRDDAAGETYDKIARSMGMPYPGGVELDRAAEKGDPLAYKFPHPEIAGAPLDFSFSGLKTAVINMLHNANQKGESLNKEDISASVRKNITDTLISKLMLASSRTGLKDIALAGGVSANSLLRKNLKEECYKRNLNVYLPEITLCGDNAAMIASQGYYEYLNGNIKDMSLNASAAAHL